MLLAGIFMDAVHAQNSMKFIRPIDGDMLCAYDAKMVNGALLTRVTVSAPSGSKIKVNGVDATPSGDSFTAEISLNNFKNQIEAMDPTTGIRQTITVFWLKNYANKFRLSLDDTISFLKDISDHSAKYKSISENLYLAFLKECMARMERKYI